MFRNLCDLPLIAQIVGEQETDTRSLGASNNDSEGTCSYYGIQLVFNLTFIYLALLLIVYHKCWQSGKCSKGKRTPTANSPTQNVPLKRSSNSNITAAANAHNHKNGKRFSRADSSNGAPLDSKRIAKWFQRRTVFSHHIAIWSLTVLTLVALSADLSENIILLVHKHSNSSTNSYSDTSTGNNSFSNNQSIISTNDKFGSNASSKSNRSSRSVSANGSAATGEQDNRWPSDKNPANGFISSASSNLFGNNDSNDPVIDLIAFSSSSPPSTASKQPSYYPVKSSDDDGHSVLHLVRGGGDGSPARKPVIPNDDTSGAHNRRQRSSSSLNAFESDDDQSGGFGEEQQIIYEHLKVIGPLVTITAVSVLLWYYHQFERLGESKHLLLNVLFFTVSTILFLTNVHLHWGVQALTLWHVKVASNVVCAFSSLILTTLLAHTVIHEVSLHTTKHMNYKHVF